MLNRRPRILIIDDDEDHRTLTTIHLSSENVDVDEAETGESGLVKIEESRPDLVLLDFHMPGMGGYQTLLELRKTFDEQALPVVMLSAHQAPDAIARALDSGANDYIAKDVDPVVLRARVRRHLQNISITKEEERDLGGYKIQRYLGRGRYSSTFLLEHPTSKDVVFARVLKPGFSLDESKLAGLQRVGHVGVSNVITWNTDPVVYVLTEFSAGKSLTDYAGQGIGIFPMIDLMTKIADTLKVTEAVGATHGDLSPDRVFVTDDGRPVLLDLGVLRCIVQDNEVTASNFHLGDPAYQSPERIRKSGSVDIRSDLYSLGALFFYLLTGRAPFVGTTREVVNDALSKPAPLVSEHRSDGVRRFDALVSRLLEKDPKDRPQSVEELQSSFRDFEFKM